MRIDTFKIEDWMNRYCPSAQYDLTTTCIEPLSIRELMEISGISKPLKIFDTKLTYGDIHGSPRLKNAIKSLYTNQKAENITVTHGAIGANQLVFEALLEKGDEVIVLIPTYQQHYAIPKALGARVKLLFLREENQWYPNLNELERNITYKTKLICISNPNNPTGMVMPDGMLRKIADIAETHNVWVLSDEAYRGLNIVGNPYSVSMADLYNKGISVGSMSKTYSLPGLRVGWVAGREDLIKEINKYREYNTISVSILDDYYASIALENRDKIVERNLNIVYDGCEILNNWLGENVLVRAHLPKGGTTALVRYIKDVPSKTLCKGLQEKTGVAILPGETFEMEGTVRIGLCMDKTVLQTGLNEFSEYLRSL